MTENKNYAAVAHHVNRTNKKHRDDFYNVYYLHFDKVKKLM